MTPSLSYLLLGLGNPGSQYAGTRHNVGFEAIDAIAERTTCRLRKLFFRPLILGAFGADAGPFASSFVCAKPLTYMNKSGDVLPYLLRKFDLRPSRICVITDNMDLAPGEIRMKQRGGTSRHNGLRSITATLETSHFSRIYIGIGRPERSDGVVEHVLGRFSPEDAELTRMAIGRLASVFQSPTFTSLEQLITLVNDQRRPEQDL